MQSASKCEDESEVIPSLNYQLITNETDANILLQLFFYDNCLVF